MSVRINKQVCQDDGAFYIEGACLHDDTKPLRNLASGSLMLEVDTGDVYAFDEEGGEWDKICALGGSGT